MFQAHPPLGTARNVSLEHLEGEITTRTVDREMTKAAFILLIVTKGFVFINCSATIQTKLYCSKSRMVSKLKET